MLDFYEGKTVLVTGDTGFKGSWLCEILSLAGAKVIGYALQPPTEPSLFNILGLADRITSVIGDVRDYRKLEKVVNDYRPQIVFHLAAQPIVLESYKNPRDTYEINVMGTVNILEAIRKANCVRSFLNVTTDKVYENKDFRNHPFKEDEKLDGFDPYSNSKSCSELVTHSYRRSFFTNSNTAISTARAGNVIGGGDFSIDRIIPDCVRAAVSHRPIKVRNRFSTRPYQFVLEPLFAYLLIAEKQFFDESFSGYYNIGPDSVDALTTGKLVQLFCDIWGEGSVWTDSTIPNAPHEAGFLSLDNSLMRKVFAWDPIYHIKDAIRLTVQWSKGYYNDGLSAAKEITDKQIHEYSAVFGK